jgi:hypothetical protein
MPESFYPHCAGINPGKYFVSDCGVFMIEVKRSLGIRALTLFFPCGEWGCNCKGCIMYRLNSKLDELGYMITNFKERSPEAGEKVTRIPNPRYIEMILGVGHPVLDVWNISL